MTNLIFSIFIICSATVQNYSENIDIYYTYNKSEVTNYFTISDPTKAKVIFVENPNIKFIYTTVINNKLAENKAEDGVFVFHTSSFCMNSFVQKYDFSKAKLNDEEQFYQSCSQSYVKKVSDNLYKYYLLKMYWLFRTYF